MLLLSSLVLRTTIDGHVSTSQSSVPHGLQDKPTNQWFTQNNRSFIWQPQFHRELVPACDIVEHWVASFGGSCLVEDVEGLQGFELLLLVDLMPAEPAERVTPLNQAEEDEPDHLTHLVMNSSNLELVRLRLDQ